MWFSPELRVCQLARWILAGSFGLALLSGATAPAAAGGVTFHDVAAEPTFGITYERFPSAIDADAEAIRQGGPTDIVNVLLGPVKAKGAPGVSLLDYDSDGDLDIYVTNGPGHDNSLYSNQLRESGRSSFVDVAAAAGAAANDQDSTGRLLRRHRQRRRPGPARPRPRRAQPLLREPGGFYVDITSRPGSRHGLSSHDSSACAMGDINGDGLLDIFVANTFDWATKIPDLRRALRPQRAQPAVPEPRAQRASRTSAPRAGIRAPLNDITWAAALVDNDQDGDVDIMSRQRPGGDPGGRYGGVDRGFIRIFAERRHRPLHRRHRRRGPRHHGGLHGPLLRRLQLRRHAWTSSAPTWATTLAAVPRPVPYSRGDQSTRWFLIQRRRHLPATPACGRLRAPVRLGHLGLRLRQRRRQRHHLLRRPGRPVTDRRRQPRRPARRTDGCNADFVYDAAALASGADHTRAHGPRRGDRRPRQRRLRGHASRSPVKIVPGRRRTRDPLRITALGAVRSTPVAAARDVHRRHPGHRHAAASGSASTSCQRRPRRSRSTAAATATAGRDFELAGHRRPGRQPAARSTATASAPSSSFTPEGGKTAIPRPGRRELRLAGQPDGALRPGHGGQGHRRGALAGRRPEPALRRAGGERVLLPEIPCSYAGTWKSFGQYNSCVQKGAERAGAERAPDRRRAPAPARERGAGVPRAVEGPGFLVFKSARHRRDTGRSLPLLSSVPRDIALHPERAAPQGIH